MPQAPSPHAPPLLAPLQGPWRRVVFVTLYELIAIAVTTFGFMLFAGRGAASSGAISIICSVVAVAWNVLFNAMFEFWESRQRRRGRSVWRRVAHAIGFEGGLALMLVPLLAWWFDVGVWQALVMDLGLLIFFLVYTFAFNWGFDRLFGLPSAAA